MKNEITEKTLVSIADAGKLLGVSPQTLRNWEKQEKLVPEYRLPYSNHRRYSLEQLARFVIKKDGEK